MKLRKLQLNDAPLMLEWMHDNSVTKHLRTDFSSKTLDDAESFIKASWEDTQNIHQAIASDENEYMGTISLKNIENGSAEFAMCVRKGAMRKGYSWIGIQALLNMAFNEYEIESIYWCVNQEDKRSIRFFDKHNFHENYDIPQRILDRYADDKNLKWYSILKGDTLESPKAVAGCKVMHITTIPTIDAGELSFFEGDSVQDKTLPFDIKRIYYISKVPEGVRRGFHAHKKLKQLLFCPYGKIQLILENKHGREEIELSDPSIGVLIDEPTWREMLWLQKDSVLCVAASDFYEVEDYIRDYDEFKQSYLK